MTSASTGPALIDQKAAALMLGCCAKTVQRLSKSDPSFPAAIRPTGSRNFVRFSRAALLDWVAARSAPPDPANA